MVKKLANQSARPVLLNASHAKPKTANRQADNYDIEITDLDLLMDQVLAAEVLLILELVGADACADVYNDGEYEGG